MTPDELVRFRSGDADLFRRLVECETPRLLGYALRLTRHAEDARELTQEAWVRAFERRSSFSGSGSLYGWLMAIAHSLFHDGLRAQRRESRMTEAVAFEEATRQWDSPADWPIVDTRIADAVGGLPPQQREVVILRVLDGLSTRDTAHRLGIAEGTVKATLHAALGKLRSALSGDEHAY